MSALFGLPVARVNDQIITAEMLLVRYGDYLQRVRRNGAPDEHAKTVQAIIARDLAQAVVISAIWSDIKANVPAETLSSWCEAVCNREELRLARELEGRGRFSIQASFSELREQLIREGIVRNYLRTKFGTMVSDRFPEYRDLLLKNSRIETAYPLKLMPDGE